MRVIKQSRNGVWKADMTAHDGQMHVGIITEKC